MRAGEFRNMSNEELAQNVRDLRRERFNLRFQLATGQLEKTDRLRKTSRDLARALTILRERALESSASEGANQ